MGWSVRTSVGLMAKWTEGSQQRDVATVGRSQIRKLSVYAECVQRVLYVSKDRPVAFNKSVREGHIQDYTDR